MKEERSEIPDEVVDAIREVHDRHLTDMYDRETVMLFTAVTGHEDAAEWLVDHRHLYFAALEKAAPDAA